MCNAWNHWSGCVCGFGQGWHSSHGNNAHNPTTIIAIARERYISYINPNARCPVCGALVFFYQSPSGGRVFFDELGPPWPKHPCTDNDKRIASYTENKWLLANYDKRRTPEWQIQGWVPAILFENGNKTSAYYVCFEVLGEFSNKFVDCFIYNDDIKILLGNSKLIYLRNLSDDEFEILAYNIQSEKTEHLIVKYAHPYKKRI